MSRFRNRVLIGSVLLPVLVGGYMLQDRSTRDGARLFDQVFTLVADRFVDTVDTAGLYEKAARGLVEQLNDRYSELLTPKQLQRFSNMSSGRYGGIGMRIENQEGNITVVQVFPHTPAERAGIVEGDRIIGVDTASTRGWSSQQVSDELIGPIGTEVLVRFARPGVAEPIVHKLTRAEIHVPAVEYALMLDRKIGYIPLQTFNETAAEELEASLQQLLKNGAKGIIIDLRNNPGGILDQGLAVADLFLDDGEQIASVRSREGAPQVFTARGKDRIPNMPLVILIDGYAASASEIVAGALQDHDRALVVGTTTFGKGLVQTLFPLDGGYALKLTTAKWFTPSGRLIHKPTAEDSLLAGDALDAPESAFSPLAPADSSMPDSLETEAVKRTRPVYRSDAGRTVYGGGGITPDIIIPEDTASAAEQEFARAVAPKSSVVRATLFDYSMTLKGSVDRNFTVQQEWRDEYLRRLQAAGVTVDREQYDAARPLVDRLLANQVARLAFGDSAAFRRSIPNDPQLLKALELLRQGHTQKELFAIAQATR